MYFEKDMINSSWKTLAIKDLDICGSKSKLLIARMPVTHTDILPVNTVIVHGLKTMLYALWPTWSVLFFLVVKSTHII